MVIDTVEKLKDFFKHSKDRLNDSIYIADALRKKWIVKDEVTIHDSKIYKIGFTKIDFNINGEDAYEAKLESTTIIVDIKQLEKLVKQKDAYEALLDKCSVVLNTSPELVSKIKETINKFK